MESVISGIDLILSAPSGAGKTTLAHLLLRRSDQFSFSISYTSRPVRGQEREGIDYYFVSADTFRQMIAEGAFAEWALVHGNYYGTAHAEIERIHAQQRYIIFDIDVQGARQLKATHPHFTAVLVLPPSMEVLESRLRSRGTDASEVVARRLRQATHEIGTYPLFDYILVNDILEDAYGDLVSIIRCQSLTTRRMAGRAESFLKDKEAGI